MPANTSSVRKIALAFVAVAATGTALVLFFFAIFPYVFAESGSQSYARAHRGAAIAQVVAGGALLWVAWRFIRRSLSLRTWLGIVATLVLLVWSPNILNSRKVPQGVRPVGSNWYATVVPQPGEIDTVYYHLYYKRGGRYESIEDLAGEYRFVPPDCIVYRGLKVIGRPIYGMCGYRIPVETFDTSTTESEVLRQARSRPAYRPDWRHRR